MPATELARPSRNVVVTASAPAAQYCLRKSGKNADITVMAKAELAQSYKAHDRIFRRSSIFFGLFYVKDLQLRTRILCSNRFPRRLAFSDLTPHLYEKLKREGLPGNILARDSRWIIVARR